MIRIIKRNIFLLDDLVFLKYVDRARKHRDVIDVCYPTFISDIKNDVWK